MHSTPSKYPTEQLNREDRKAAIREELRKIDDKERVRVRRRRDRQASFDSFDSFGESYRSHGSGRHSDAHYSSDHRSHGSNRGRMFDTGFASSRHNPYNVYNTESYFSGLGQGFGELVRGSGRRWATW